MIRHSDLGNAVFSRNRKLKGLINQGRINLAGNIRLKIFGTLQCKSGKRMKVANRVFIISANEAIVHGYRPCGNCMKEAYKKWRKRFSI